MTALMPMPKAQRKRVAMTIWADVTREVSVGAGRTITHALKRVMARQDMALFRAHQARIDKEKEKPLTPRKGGARKKGGDRTPTTEVCRRYLAGTCTRGGKCKYAHPRGKEGSTATAAEDDDEEEDAPAAPAKKQKKK